MTTPDRTEVIAALQELPLGRELTIRTNVGLEIAAEYGGLVADEVLLFRRGASAVRVSVDVIAAILLECSSEGPE